MKSNTFPAKKKSGIKRLGLLVQSEAPNQSYLKLVQSSSKIYKRVDISLFYVDQVPPCVPLPYLKTNISDSFFFTGPMLATSFDTAKLLIDNKAAASKYFYCVDLDWTQMPQRDFEYISRVYLNTDLKFIARSESHKNALKSVWGINVIGIVEDFDLEKIEELINHATTS